MIQHYIQLAGGPQHGQHFPVKDWPFEHWQVYESPPRLITSYISEPTPEDLTIKYKTFDYRRAVDYGNLHLFIPHDHDRPRFGFECAEGEFDVVLAYRQLKELVSGMTYPIPGCWRFVFIRRKSYELDHLKRESYDAHLTCEGFS